MRLAKFLAGFLSLLLAVFGIGSVTRPFLYFGPELGLGWEIACVASGLLSFAVAVRLWMWAWRGGDASFAGK